MFNICGYNMNHISIGTRAFLDPRESFLTYIYRAGTKLQDSKDSEIQKGSFQFLLHGNKEDQGPDLSYMHFDVGSSGLNTVQTFCSVLDADGGQSRAKNLTEDYLRYRDADPSVEQPNTGEGEWLPSPAVFYPGAGLSCVLRDSSIDSLWVIGDAFGTVPLWYSVHSGLKTGSPSVLVTSDFLGMHHLYANDNGNENEGDSHSQSPQSDTGTRASSEREREIKEAHLRQLTAVGAGQVLKFNSKEGVLLWSYFWNSNPAVQPKHGQEELWLKEESRQTIAGLYGAIENVIAGQTKGIYGTDNMGGISDTDVVLYTSEGYASSVGLVRCAAEAVASGTHIHTHTQSASSSSSAASNKTTVTVTVRTVVIPSDLDFQRRVSTEGGGDYMDKDKGKDSDMGNDIDLLAGLTSLDESTVREAVRAEKMCEFAVSDSHNPPNSSSNRRQKKVILLATASEKESLQSSRGPWSGELSAQAVYFSRLYCSLSLSTSSPVGSNDKGQNTHDVGDADDMDNVVDRTSADRGVRIVFPFASTDSVYVPEETQGVYSVLNQEGVCHGHSDVSVGGRSQHSSPHNTGDSTAASGSEFLEKKKKTENDSSQSEFHFWHYQLYQQAKKHASADGGYLFVVLASEGYTDLLKNWLCSVRHVLPSASARGQLPVLVLTDDAGVERTAKESGAGVLRGARIGTGTREAGDGSFAFGTVTYQQLVLHRTQSILELLLMRNQRTLRVVPVVADIDTVWLTDPLQHIRLAAPAATDNIEIGEETFDIAVTDDHGEVCGCLVVLYDYPDIDNKDNKNNKDNKDNKDNKGNRGSCSHTAESKVYRPCSSDHDINGGHHSHHLHPALSFWWEVCRQHTSLVRNWVGVSTDGTELGHRKTKTFDVESEQKILTRLLTLVPVPVDTPHDQNNQNSDKNGDSDSDSYSEIIQDNKGNNGNGGSNGNGGTFNRQYESVSEFSRISGVPLNVRLLPKKAFPSGRDFFLRTSGGGDSHMCPLQEVGVSIVHNNFIIGKDRKVARFKRWGLWDISVSCIVDNTNGGTYSSHKHKNKNKRLKSEDSKQQTPGRQGQSGLKSVPTRNRKYYLADFSYSCIGHIPERAKRRIATAAIILPAHGQTVCRDSASTSASATSGDGDGDGDGRSGSGVGMSMSESMPRVQIMAHVERGSSSGSNDSKQNDKDKDKDNDKDGKGKIWIGADPPAYAGMSLYYPFDIYVYICTCILILRLVFCFLISHTYHHLFYNTT